MHTNSGYAFIYNGNQKDQRLELEYIAGNLYGNLKQREYIEEHPINLGDVVQFKAPWNKKDIKANHSSTETPTSAFC